jgi:SAM-dependent methyltransferase
VSEVTVVSEVRSQEFPEEWYDLSGGDHFWFRWRLAALRRALTDGGARLDTPTLALDVGCGSGVLAGQLEAAGAWTVEGTDLNLAALERCPPRRGRTLYYDVTEERPELLGRYGALILFDVLEHLPEPRRLAQSALRHLAPGGLLLVNVPALPALRSAYDDAAGHLRRYTRQTLSAELSGLGVRELGVRYWGLTLVPLLALRKLAVARAGPRTIERGFQPPFPAVNTLLTGLMRLETWALPRPPLGTSVLFLGMKE